MKIDIQLATEEHLPDIHRMMQEAFEEYRDLEMPSSAVTEPLEQLLKAYRTGLEQAVLCSVDGMPVGSVRFKWKDQALYFSRLSVTPSARGKGLAKAMLAWLENYALENGKEKIECLVRATLPENISLYCSIGYRVTKTEEVINPNGFSVKVATMEKNLVQSAQAIIFDMDGTLFQTNTILEFSLHDTFDYLREVHLWKEETPIKTYRDIMGVPLEVVWATLMPNHSVEVRNKVNDIFHKHLISHIQAGNGALYPNVVELLQALKDNDSEIFIASNGQTEYLQAIVSYYKLNRWVTETFSIDQIDSMKKSDLVAMIIKKYGFLKGAVVGDRLSDIEAAKSNKLMAIGCRFDFAKDEELAQADYVIDDLLELKAIL